MHWPSGKAGDCRLRGTVESRIVAVVIHCQGHHLQSANV
jgi:hypothetical protein